MREPTNYLRGNWPFPAKRLPVFYGWVIAVVSTLGYLASIPGQTMGMAVFADVFIEKFGLSRTTLSIAYMLGTVASALLLTWAGRLYDRHGARTLLVGASLMLAAALVMISFTDTAAQTLAAWTGMHAAVFSFALITVGYFGVRFAGQGVMTSASTNVLLLWFVKRRGLVTGFRGVFVSLGFSIAPLPLALLIDVAGWREALWWLALLVLAGFGVLALLLVRDRPEVCNLRADGESTSQDDLPPVAPSSTLEQARRSAVFWVYALPLAMHALFGTALTFHIAAIFESAGRSRTEAFAYFVPQAVVSVATNLSISALSDYTRLKGAVVGMLVAFLFGTAGLLYLHTNWGYWLLVAGFGVGGGLWGVLSNLAFVRQFGTVHLGEIHGFMASLTVLGSAIGPLAFSLARDYLGSFSAAAWVCGVVLLALLIFAIVVSQPHDQPPARQLRHP